MLGTLCMMTAQAVTNLGVDTFGAADCQRVSSIDWNMSD